MIAIIERSRSETFFETSVIKSTAKRCLLDDGCVCGDPVLVLWASYVKNHRNVIPYISTQNDIARFSGADLESPLEFSDALKGMSAAAALDYIAWSRRQRGSQGCRVDYRSVATINQRVSILKAFYRLAVADGILPRNPFERIRPLHGKPKRPTKAIPIEKLRSVIDAAACPCERALLSALIGGALRRSEAEKLRIEDVTDHDGITALILRATKNGDNEVQPLAPWAAEAVLAWRDIREAAGAAPRDPLFASRYGKGAGVASMNGQTICRIVQRVCRRAGIGDPGIGAHSCRASGVTALLTAGVDRKKVKTFGRFHSYHMLDVYDKRAEPLSEHAGLLLKLER